ncbi:E3 SUMO-protein ligase KIAA1586-like [Larimichthys crocea]|uniref:E3 SUMO-protein ligase KIAA1586-like n=1 Tax=Larimichthys crocea TaxID=215358 RepID=UPI000F603CC5|nr:E3 SUMO-protein ligase KIAA1586-like [Larimichthys crocea]
MEWSQTKVTYSHNGNRQYQLSCLRSKIYKHAMSKSHKAAEELSKKKSTIDVSILKQLEGEVDKTASLFRTAYHMAKKNRPYTDYQDLVVLQQANGLDMGITLHSRYSAKNIIDHTAQEMRNKILNHILTEDKRFSVLIDESTTLSKKSALVVYLTSTVNNVPTVIFLDLVELESQSAENITNTLLQCLTTCGLNENFIRTNFVAFACDGASAMLGRKSGVATRLQQMYPELIVWHCLNHRLELAVGDTVKKVNNVNHFTSFLDKVYTVYHRSPKNTRELAQHAEELEIHVQKIGRVLDVRWAASSFRTVKAVWNSYRALHHHFSAASVDCTRDENEKAMYRGLMTKMETQEFLCDLGLMYDTLEEISHLSLTLQERGMTLTRADKLMKRTIRIIASMIISPGDKRKDALAAAEREEFHGIPLTASPRLRRIDSAVFLQSLTENLEERLFSTGSSRHPGVSAENTAQYTDLLENFNVLIPENWPVPLQEQYGETCIKQLAHRFRLDTRKALEGFRDYKENSSEIPENLSPLTNILNLIPVSNAECERGFSLMNIIVSPLRCRVSIQSVSSLMFVNLNGPPLIKWNPKDYVKSWLLKHRAASDPRARPCTLKYPTDKEALWALL